MQQIIRKGIKDILVDDVPEPVAAPHHVLVRPVFSLISSGTETASIHQEGVLKEVADNPSHIRQGVGRDESERSGCDHTRGTRQVQ